MALTIITGVPGTGKTAFVVSQLEDEAKKGRVIFSNIVDLKIPHFGLGNFLTWQAGTWLHIDRYVRTTPSLNPPVSKVLADESNDDFVDDFGDENWAVNPDVFLADTGVLMVRMRDANRQVVGATEYQSHKGALIVIDECQSYFRPRPSGSVVPDHVAALEVHRKQGIDIWLITQRQGLIDSNVRGLCGKHIALRSTALGRYKYEWPEVGDIDSKASRDTAARTRYKLPKHVFGLYKSAEVHTKHGHAMPFVAKAMFFVFPMILFFSYQAYAVINGKFHAKSVVVAQQPVQQQALSLGDALSANHKGTEMVSSSFVPPVVSVLPVSDLVQISACLATSTKCQCYNHDGIHLVMSDADCRAGAAAPNDKFRLNDQVVSNR